MVEVYDKGQIVIPKYIRDMLHLVPGTQLNARVEARKIILEPADNYFEEFERLTTRKTGRSDEEVEKRIGAAKKKMLAGWRRVH
ncbi:MAG: AbrB/MazE/SpoVT family DNA-binding domain-containing protein [Candidatus Micrarchaeota archaeon]